MQVNQLEFHIRLEWGIKGIEVLAPISDVLIIVDILSFSTSVDIATSNGAIVLPYTYKDQTAQEFATTHQALLAQPKRSLSTGFTLSPSSLLKISPGTKLVLPSPNGSTLSLFTSTVPTICGCLRNAQVVAEYARGYGKNIGIIPAGERWEDGTLRVACEDLLGAGAILSYLKGKLSPESRLAQIAFTEFKDHLTQKIKGCGSGKELIARGFEQDIDLACAVNSSDNIPILINNQYHGSNL